MPEETSIAQQQTQKQSQPTPFRTGKWGKIRERIAQLLGKEGDAIDKNWISKLKAKIDETSQEISLKARTSLVKDYVEDRYLDLMTNVIQKHGFNFKGLII